MDPATLIPLVLKTSIFMTVFGLALNATMDDALYLFRRPSELARSLLSMNVIMPLFAAALAAAFDLHPAVEIALVTLAVSPVPPILPKKELKAGGHASYAIGLLVAAGALAIVFVPAAVELLGRVFGRSIHISVATIAQLVLFTVLFPLAAGIAVRHFAPAFADRIARPISLVAAVLLIASALPIVFTAWPAITSLIGNGTIIAIAAFVIFGLTIGHLLGGPEEEDRTVLALSTASRHPGIALAIAGASFPGQKLVLGAVLLYLIVNAVVSLPYLNWRRRHQAGIAGAVGT
jgi:bile acid:Na+ symporter, BASS family